MNSSIRSGRGAARQRIQPVQLTDSALISLSTYLRTQNVQVGDRLPAEWIIAEQLGISRPILREALKRWVALGIIETRNGSGSYLRRPHEPGETYVIFSVSAERHRLLQLLELRRALEVEAAGLAAARRGEPDAVTGLLRFWQVVVDRGETEGHRRQVA